jgi:hypothetical protein
MFLRVSESLIAGRRQFDSFFTPFFRGDLSFHSPLLFNFTLLLSPLCVSDEQVNPSKLGPEENLEENQTALLNSCNLFLQSIVKASDKAPVYAFFTEFPLEM